MGVSYTLYIRCILIYVYIYIYIYIYIYRGSYDFASGLGSPVVRKPHLFQIQLPGLFRCPAAVASVDALAFRETSEEASCAYMA